MFFPHPLSCPLSCFLPNFEAASAEDFAEVWQELWTILILQMVQQLPEGKASSCQMQKFVHIRSQKDCGLNLSKCFWRILKVFFPTRKTLIAPILTFISVSLLSNRGMKNIKPYILEILGLVPWSYCSHPLIQIIHEKPNYQLWTKVWSSIWKASKILILWDSVFVQNWSCPIFLWKWTCTCPKMEFFPSALPKERF